MTTDKELKKELEDIFQRLGESGNLPEEIALLQDGVRGTIKNPQQLSSQIENVQKVQTDLQTFASRITKSPYFAELAHLAALAKEGYKVEDAEIILPAYNDEDYLMERNSASFGRDQLPIADYLERILRREGMLFFAGETRVWMQTQYGVASLTKPTLLVAGDPSEFGGMWPDWLPHLWIYAPEDKVKLERAGREGVASWINIPLSSSEIMQRIDYFSSISSSLEFYITQHPSLAVKNRLPPRMPKVKKRDKEKLMQAQIGTNNDEEFNRLLKENIILNKATHLTFKSEGRLYYLPHAEWEVQSGFINPK